MLIFNKISALFYFICKLLIKPWLKTRVLPTNFEALNIDLSKPICYVMESRSTSNLALLDIECKKLGLPSPRTSLGEDELADFRSVYSVLPKKYQRAKYAHMNKDTGKLRELLHIVANSEQDLDVQFVPAFVLWGRPVGKEGSWYHELFADTWNIVGRFRQTIVIILNGRNTLLQFSAAISARQLLKEHSPENIEIKLNDIAAKTLYDVRHAIIGPDLSGRQLMMTEILKAKPVKAAIATAMEDKKWSHDKAVAVVRKYVDEIAANYSSSAIKLFEILLNWVWDKIYDGVEVNNFNKLLDAAKGNGVIYVPCHRSHIDYLLLSYVLYKRNIVPPHIAAGINLNLPIIGSFLRFAGAFFIRRSFRGNRLYSAVFNEYLHQNLIRGVSIEYFIEGGRSRTGRLLAPRPGMLQMTVQSFLRNNNKPLVFVPIFIGYEKLIESKTYVRELGGQKKKKESVFGLIRAFSRLRGSFGKVYVNFGKPIYLQQFLDSNLKDWRYETYGANERPQWLSDTVVKLGEAITTGINDAAVVNPVNIVASVLLSTPKRAMGEEELTTQVRLYLALINKLTYFTGISLPTMTPVEIVKYVETTGLLQRYHHDQGDVLSLDDKSSILMTYYKNNIMHLFAIPSLIASCFINKREMSDEKVIALVKNFYPFFKRELSLHALDDASIESLATQAIQALLDMGLLVRHWDTNELRRPVSTDIENLQLQILAQTVRAMLERYYMAIYMLKVTQNEPISVSSFQKKMVSLAKRMSILYDINAPEYSDKTLFVGLAHTLKEQSYVSIDNKQCMQVTKDLSSFMEQAKVLLNQKMRHSILQIVIK